LWWKFLFHHIPFIIVFSIGEIREQLFADKSFVGEVIEENNALYERDFTDFSVAASGMLLDVIVDDFFFCGHWVIPLSFFVVYIITYFN
jgi:hypothetical protein